MVGQGPPFNVVDVQDFTGSGAETRTHPGLTIRVSQDGAWLQPCPLVRCRCDSTTRHQSAGVSGRADEDVLFLADGEFDGRIVGDVSEREQPRWVIDGRIVDANGAALDVTARFPV